MCLRYDIAIDIEFTVFFPDIKIVHAQYPLADKRAFVIGYTRDRAEKEIVQTMQLSSKFYVWPKEMP